MSKGVLFKKIRKLRVIVLVLCTLSNDHLHLCEVLWEKLEHFLLKEWKQK